MKSTKERTEEKLVERRDKETERTVYLVWLANATARILKGQSISLLHICPLPPSNFPLSFPLFHFLLPVFSSLRLFNFLFFPYLLFFLLFLFCKNPSTSHGDTQTGRTQRNHSSIEMTPEAPIKRVASP